MLIQILIISPVSLIREMEGTEGDGGMENTGIMA